MNPISISGLCLLWITLLIGLNSATKLHTKRVMHFSDDIDDFRPVRRSLDLSPKPSKEDEPVPKSGESSPPEKEHKDMQNSLSSRAHKGGFRRSTIRNINTNFITSKNPWKQFQQFKDNFFRPIKPSPMFSGWMNSMQPLSFDAKKVRQVKGDGHVTPAVHELKKLIESGALSGKNSTSWSYSDGSTTITINYHPH